MHTQTFTVAAALLVTLAWGCGKKDSQNQSPDPTPVAQPTPAEAQIDAQVPQGVSGRHRAQEGWVPAEYKKGKGRWKDSGVYLDGQPIGMLRYGELPISLQPIWLDTVESLDFRPGDKGPHERKIKQPRFRIAELLEAMHIDLKKVKEIHIYGGRAVARVEGKELIRVHDDLHFSFGGVTHGKALIHFPEGMKVNTGFDHIAAIAVYIDKLPPTLRDFDTLVLGGDVVVGIPYFGEPLRGGVRIYKDDRLATVIKRRELTDASAQATQTDGGEFQWKLFPYLETKGVDASDIVLADLMFNDRNIKRMTRAEMKDLSFTANPMARGQILLGEDKLAVHGIMFYTEQVPKRVELPESIE